MTHTSSNKKFGLTKQKNSNFSEWYIQTITKSDFLSPYSIRGLSILRPPCTFIWSCIRSYINDHISKLNVHEYYFPMLINESDLNKEKDHIENFQPEVAWITRSGNNNLDNPLAIRPTSETIMYPFFSKIIRSHRDLPLKVNQWCNILRWEVKSTVPLIRGREFLWQEGHCAYQTKEECDNEVMNIINLYYDVYKELLAVPVIRGRKSEAEKFGGADYTLTVESYIKGSGRAVQAATSHSLGTNFARMFDIKADDYVYQSSWGLTTRSIGVAVMVHGDDIGLVLPPRVAYIQIIIIPCGKVNDGVNKYINDIKEKLKKYRIEVDDRTNVNPGFKFNDWEIKGIPLRIEIGQRDVKNNSMVVVPRHTLEKTNLTNDDDLEVNIQNILDNMHNDLYNKAFDELTESIKKANNWNDFIAQLNENNMLLISWCNTAICEEMIKEESAIKNENNEVVNMGAKSLCIPFDYQNDIEEKCMKCGKEAKVNAIFGRSY